MRAFASFVVRRSRAIVAIWVLIALAAAIPAGQLTERIGNGGYEVPGSQSQRVDTLNAENFPRTNGQSLAAVITSSSPAHAELQRRARNLQKKLNDFEDVKFQGRPYASHSGEMIVVPFILSGSIADAQKAVVPLRTFVREVAGPDATVVGRAAVWEETTAISKEDLARAERISVPISLVILAAAFLSVVAALIPIGLAIVSIVVVFAALGLLSHAIDMSVYVTNTAQLLGLGLAIDYSLFIVSRYREQRGKGASSDEAIIDALTTTGRAVLVSGLTIALGLSSLAVLGVGVFGSMALGASAAAAVAALGALTLVPAILRLLGNRIDSLTITPAMRAAKRGHLWHALGELILRRRWIVLTSSFLILFLCAVPILGTKLIVAGTDGLLPESNQLRLTSDAIASEFGPGALEPIEIMSRPRYANRIRTAVLRDPGVADVPLPKVSKDGWSRIMVLPSVKGGSEAGDEAIRRIRQRVDGLAPSGEAYVGGGPSLGVDLVDRVEERLPLMILVACALAFILLLVALRSIVVPLKAVATNLLSVAATLGLVTLIFQNIGGADGLAWYVPPFLFAIVFGLSMDYEVFLLSRVREEYDSGLSNDNAVVSALRQSGRPITLAAVVIMVVFLSSADTNLESFRQLGVGMAIAVFLDATLVRCALVPAALAVLGDRNWWLPAFMERRIPGRPSPASQSPAPAPASSVD